MNSEVTSVPNMHKSFIDRLLRLLTINACRSSVRVHQQNNDCKIEWAEDISGSISSGKSLTNQNEYDEWRDVLKSDDNVLKNHQSLVISGVKPLGPKDIRIEMDDEVDIKQPSPKDSHVLFSGTDVFRRCDGLCHRVIAKNKLKSFVPCCHMVCEECTTNDFGGASNCFNADCIVQKMIDRLANGDLKATLVQQLSDNDPDYEAILNKLLEEEQQMDFHGLSPVSSLSWSNVKEGMLDRAKSIVAIAREKVNADPAKRKKLPLDEAELRSRGYVNRQCERFYPADENASPKQVSVYEDYGIRSSKCTASPFAPSLVDLKSDKKVGSSCLPQSCLRGKR